MTGANAFVIADTANHRDLKSTQIYARLNRTVVRESMFKATESMTGIKVKDEQVMLTETKTKEKPKKKVNSKVHNYRFGMGINERVNLFLYLRKYR